MKFSYLCRLWLCAVFMAFVSITSEVKADERFAEVFDIKTFDLISVEYPWGKELSLHLKAKLDPMMKNSILTITVFYRGRRCQVFYCVIESKAEGKIELDHWALLNKGAQEILPGEYKVKIELEVQQQPPEFQEMWRRRFGARGWMDYKSFEIYDEKEAKRRNETYEQQCERIHAELKKFYLQRIKRMNELYQKLQNKKQEALLIPQNVMEVCGVVGSRTTRPALLLSQYRSERKDLWFAEEGKFSRRKWAKWFTEVMRELKKERKILEKHWQRVYFPRYPISLTCMLKYASVIERMANVMAQDVYQVYDLELRPGEYEVDPEAIKDPTDIACHIRDLHQKVKSELQSTFPEMGYTPLD